MTERGKVSGRILASVVFALGLGIGWAGATHKALRDARARDAGNFEEMRRRLDEEFIRLLDLSPEQQARFAAARAVAVGKLDGLFARLRPEADLVFADFDREIRPLLSPRQLAVYDRIEQEHRRQLPQRPEGAGD